MALEIDEECKWAVMGCMDGAVLLCDLTTVWPRLSYFLHSAVAICVALWKTYRPNSAHHLSNIFSFTQNRAFELHKHSGPVTCLAVDWAGQCAVSGSEDTTLRVSALPAGVLE